MSYRCSGCNKVVGPNVQMCRYVIYRDRINTVGDTLGAREIAKELPVCETCAPKVAEAEAVLALTSGQH